ncbi:hypothetical protein ECE50_012600 [Chitinophaga sp. Mgbs1]|uniref:Uncharacterized protein n=1 Tax=Chitinophaga solisilvae TaxID=1233460 RepID=A0A3S1D3T7_9BACT|nr:hypothetical protein [Chitinophaga solisilvae]
MESADILALWKSYSLQLDTSLALNRKNAADITRLKVQSLLAVMKPVKIFTLIAGILWVAFLDMLIISLFQAASPFFLVSAIIQVLLTKLAIGVYVYQLVLIHQADLSEPVFETQRKLAALRTSTLWVTRLLFLQLPVWTTFYLNTTMLTRGPLLLLIIQVLVTLLFTAAAVWLFVNIRYENRNKHWFRLLFAGKEWAPVIKSMELLSQIGEERD